jgi:hypothetical protein
MLFHAWPIIMLSAEKDNDFPLKIYLIDPLTCLKPKAYAATARNLSGCSCQPLRSRISKAMIKALLTSSVFCGESDPIKLVRNDLGILISSSQ